jgi:hypothetical protein
VNNKKNEKKNYITSFYLFLFYSFSRQKKERKKIFPIPVQNKLIPEET